MIYPYPIVPGIFENRPNRFIALCRIDGQVHRCHVKNTGRCRELLIPGARVWLTCHDDPGRSTAFSLIAAEKDGLLINMDSQAPNQVAWEALTDGALLGFIPDFCRREYTDGDSRIDLYAQQGEEKYLIEVKGVTLEEGGHGRFPDAPTQRGVKHIRHLQTALDRGYHSILLFLLQFSPGAILSPNDETDPAFGAALRKAAAAGVILRAADCVVTPDSMVYGKEVPVCLNS